MRDAGGIPAASSHKIPYAEKSAVFVLECAQRRHASSVRTYRLSTAARIASHVERYVTRRRCASATRYACEQFTVRVFVTCTQSGALRLYARRACRVINVTTARRCTATCASRCRQRRLPICVSFRAKRHTFASCVPVKPQRPPRSCSAASRNALLPNMHVVMPAVMFFH